MDGGIDAQEFYRRLTSVLVAEMNCARASIWRYRDTLVRDRIQCLQIYDRTDQTWSSGVVLKEEDFGPYFEQMRRDNLIVASDARRYPSTSCFNEIYFEPLGIYSLLDVGISIGGEPFGLFCCEHTTDILEWTPEHAEYLRQVGMLIGYALKKAQSQ